ncbi:hypothetical protein AAG570_008604 [Ranatra chinensis]|uniref:Uncharacterized protein n=1 Tax=Ranatra chinensis TaxID=642074 RepID=A0ABD0YRF7_9HEMI
MGSKCRNMFYENKKQETMENALDGIVSTVCPETVSCFNVIERNMSKRSFGVRRIMFVMLEAAIIILYLQLTTCVPIPVDRGLIGVEYGLWRVERGFRKFGSEKKPEYPIEIAPTKRSVKDTPLDDPRSGWGYGAVRGSEAVEGTGRDAEWSWHGWRYGRRVSSAPAEETTSPAEKTAPGGDLPEGEERIRVRMVTLPEEEGGLKCTPGERLTVTSESEGVVWVVGRILACTPERDPHGKPQLSVTMEITEVEEFFHWMSGKNEEQKCNYEEKGLGHN